MRLAQRALERVVQRLRVDRLARQVAFGERVVDFDHLLDQRAMRRLDAAEIGGRAAGFEETVDDFAAAARRQVDRQALLAERGAQLFHACRQVDVVGVDAVDHDEAAQAARLRPQRHARRRQLDAVLRADDDCHRLDRVERRHRAAGEVRVARRVEQVHANAVALEVRARQLQRMPMLFFERIVVADGAAALDGSGAGERAVGRQQRFDQRRLADARVADEGQRSQVRTRVRGHAGLPGEGGGDGRHRSMKASAGPAQGLRRSGKAGIVASLCVATSRASCPDGRCGHDPSSPTSRPPRKILFPTVLALRLPVGVDA